MPDWSRVLSNGWPGSPWTLHDANDINTLEWFDHIIPQPTNQEIIDKAQELAAAFQAKDNLQVVLEQFEQNHPYWQIILAIKRDGAGLAALKTALENIDEADLVAMNAVN